MNKSELIAHVAAKAGTTKTVAAASIDAVIDGISDTLKKGGEVAITGFGTFKVTKRAARNGRNPKTGETMPIAAKKNPTFKAGKGLKDAVA